MCPIDRVARHDDVDCIAYARAVVSCAQDWRVYPEQSNAPDGMSGALISASPSIHGGCCEMSAAGGAAIVVAAGGIIPLLEAGQAS